MAKDPAFLFYPADASNDTQFMNRLERGAYFDLMKAQRLFGGYTAVQARKVLGSDFDAVWPSLELVLEFDGERYYIGWLRESISKRDSYSQKQRERVKKRWDDHGNTAVLPKKENEIINVIEDVNTEKGLSREKHKSRPQDENECLEYFCELNRPDEAQKFFDYFSSNGWKVGGKAPMKDWKAAARNWIRNARGTPNEDRGERVFGKVHKKDLIDTYEKLKEYEQEQQLRGTDNREAQDQQGALSDTNH